MNTQPHPGKPKPTKGGPLDIKEKHVLPVGSDADLKRGPQPLDRPAQTADPRLSSDDER
jgi:hypothetical protein